MLSVHLIQRHFETRRFDQLLAGVLANSLPAPLPMQVRLLSGPTPAVALGLRRLVELTYGPTTLSRAMTAFLLNQQLPDGSFDHDPLATACAVAAFSKILHEQPAAGDEAMRVAYQRGLAALTAMQSYDTDRPGFRHADDRSRQDTDLTTAFILALLAGDCEFRQMVRFAEIADDFEQRQDELEPSTEHLWLLAQMDAGTTTIPLAGAMAA